MTDGWTLFCELPEGTVVEEFVHYQGRLFVRCQEAEIYEIFPDGTWARQHGEVRDIAQ